MLIPFGVLSAAGVAPAILNGVAGYLAGGLGAASVQFSVVDKLAFDTETKSSLAASLSQNTFANAGMTNSNVAGYSAGGQSVSSYISTIDKFTYSTDAKSTLGTGLSGNRAYAAGASDSGVAGYIAGGDSSSAPTGRRTTIDKFAFPGDTRSTLGTGLSSARFALAGLADYGVAAYFAGGDTGAASSTVDKFAFPSDTRSTLGTGLSSATFYNLIGIANQGVAGYFGLNSANLDKFAFPSDTRTTIAFGGDYGTGGSLENRAICGYVAGGGNPFLNEFEKLSFVDDTSSTIAATLSAGKGYMASFSNSGAI